MLCIVNNKDYKYIWLILNLSNIIFVCWYIVVVRFKVREDYNVGFLNINNLRFIFVRINMLVFDYFYESLNFV